MIIENFNTTNQTIPIFARHENFVTDIKMPSCGSVVSIPFDQRCEYVTTTPQCIDQKFFLNYLDFIYCWLDSSKLLHIIFGEIVLIFACTVLFILLGSTSDGFFCPCLKVISEIMHLNENVAGLTLLAFGNCAPDVLTGLTGLNTDSRILYSDCLASSMFVLFFVGGTIIVCVPFVIHSQTFLRDISFLLFGIVYIHYATAGDNSVTIAESIGIIAIYVCFIIVVVIDQYLLNRKIKEEKREKKKSIIEPDVKAVSVESREIDIFQQFFYSINPIDKYDWEKGGKFVRTLMAIKAPFVLILRVLIPIVDLEVEGNGWSKMLNCMQIVVLPAFITLITIPERKFYGFPVYSVVSLITLPMALLTYKCTTASKVPKYHRYLAFLALIGSMVVIYSCAGEIVSIMYVMGIITRLSNSFLGCTLLAWGNSVGDLIANVNLARNGYEKMGFAACIGGPLFNCLTSIGSGMFYKAFTTPGMKTDKFTVGQGSMGETLNNFMVMGLILVIAAASITNFILRRSLGASMIIVYLIFITYAVLIEMEISHSFGTDHRLEMVPELAPE